VYNWVVATVFTSPIFTGMYEQPGHDGKCEELCCPSASETARTDSIILHDVMFIKENVCFCFIDIKVV